MGSTSNYFRSREALITGIVARLEARDYEDCARVSPAPTPGSVAGLSRILAQLVIIATTTDRVRTQARYALFVEAATAEADSEIVGSIQRSRHQLAALVPIDPDRSGCHRARPQHAAAGRLHGRDDPASAHRIEDVTGHHPARSGGFPR